MRSAIPHPCIGSSCSARSTSMSRVPCSTSLLSVTSAPLDERKKCKVHSFRTSRGSESRPIVLRRPDKWLEAARPAGWAEAVDARRCMKRDGAQQLAETTSRKAGVGSQQAFRDLVREDLLLWFCRHHGYRTDGFHSDIVQRTSAHDARWFLNALTMSPSSLSAWEEPVIAIDAASRLHTTFGWPKPLVGLQAETLSRFDIVA